MTGLTGTAVTVQAMVFGNTGAVSGSGVGFTAIRRRARTAVTWISSSTPRGRTSSPVGISPTTPSVRWPPFPVWPTGSKGWPKLETLFRDAQDFEFAVQEGTCGYCRPVPPSARHGRHRKIACDLVDEGIIDESTALERLDPYEVASISPSPAG